jgi:hypothetical protein
MYHIIKQFNLYKPGLLVMGKHYKLILLIKKNIKEVESIEYYFKRLEKLTDVMYQASDQYEILDKIIMLYSIINKNND